MEEYTGAMKTIDVVHNSKVCNNHKYAVSPNNFLRGRRCPECNRISKMNSKEDFTLNIKELVEDEYTFLEEYKGSPNPIKVRHNSKDCSYNEYYVSPNNFIDKDQRCPVCSYEKYLNKDLIKRSNEYINEIKVITDGEFSVLSNYENNRTPIKIRHNSNHCENHSFYTNPYSFKTNPVCIACSGSSINNAVFLKQVKELAGEEYTFLEDYVKDNVLIKVRHNNESCNNHEYYVQPNNFKNGRRCPVCRSSKGEVKISEVLSNFGLKFEREYEVAHGSKTFRYDFALIGNNNNIYKLIEYDGIQHFEPVKLFRGIEGFKQTVENDKIKNKIAKEMNVPLLRIKYTDYDNIEELICTACGTQLKCD